MRSPIRVLMVSAPGGDRGPAIGYANHMRALTGDERFQVEVLTEEMWHSPGKFESYDVAWAYVRFHPEILIRCKRAGIPLIAGPNVALERADLGITDEWERWFLQESCVPVNLNVADYYSKRVGQFVNPKTSCLTLEYCYEDANIERSEETNRDIDVLVYAKDRVNDAEAAQRVSTLVQKLVEKGLSYQILWYGNHTREEYVSLCRRSKTTAWLSIEDYCSLAQIESQLAGSCVIGTPYNLTIPTQMSCVCNSSQLLGSNWIEWEADDRVADDYVNAIERTLATEGLAGITSNTAKLRHSYRYYSDAVEKIITRL